VAFFGALFAARTDIYAVRYENRRAGRAGWVPAVRGGWRKGVPHAERDYLPLTAEVLAAHLSGKRHIGLYPLLDGDRCWWLAADFDGPDAMFDALMYLKAARALQVPAALEVSRSGTGAHTWVFFTGRVLRPHPGKVTAEIHDYHDTATGVLAATLAGRAAGYTSLGFPDPRRIRPTPSAQSPVNSAGHAQTLVTRPPELIRPDMTDRL
jgi:TOTE conflict system, Archaeo-Eukaryotic Primase domain